MAILIVIAVVLVVGYVVSVKRHPFTACRWCNGGNKHKGAVFRYGFRPCTHCNGSGRKRRLGAQVLGSGN